MLKSPEAIFPSLAVLCFLGGCSDDQHAGTQRDAGTSTGGADAGASESGAGGRSIGGGSGGTSGRGGGGSNGTGGSEPRSDGGEDSGMGTPDGSGGAGMHPPPKDAGTCSHLPDPGTWEDVTPHGSYGKAVNGTVGAAVVVDPFDPRTVWLGTGSENDEIWRSDDCGATWARVNTGPGSVGDGMTFGGVGDGAQWSMQVDPVAPGVLYAVSGYGAQSMWKTTDGGTSWKDILAGSEYNIHAAYRFVNNVSLDPTDHLHVVVSTHGGCSAPYEPSCLAETKDGGKTWRVLRAPEGWFEGGGIVVVKGGQWIWCGSTL